MEMYRVPPPPLFSVHVLSSIFELYPYQNVCTSHRFLLLTSLFAYLLWLNVLGCCVAQPSFCFLLRTSPSFASPFLGPLSIFHGALLTKIPCLLRHCSDLSTWQFVLCLCCRFWLASIHINQPYDATLERATLPFCICHHDDRGLGPECPSAILMLCFLVVFFFCHYVG